MKEPKKYTIPKEEPMMANEILVTYNADKRQIILTIPKGVDANVVRDKVNEFYKQLLDEIKLT